jgi:hypothetical protein
LDEELARRALTIIRERYADFGPTLACEKLWECHGIRLPRDTFRKPMTDAGQRRRHGNPLLVSIKSPLPAAPGETGA